MTFIYYTFIFLFLFLCVLLSFIVLIQDSKSFGLGASFGGDSSDSLFGTSTASVIKKVTAYMATIFLVSCVFLSLWTSALGRSQNVRELPSIEQIED